MIVSTIRAPSFAARAHATIETVNAGHLSLISRPEAVTKMIEAAAAATS